MKYVFAFLMEWFTLLLTMNCEHLKQIPITTLTVSISLSYKWNHLLRVFLQRCKIFLRSLWLYFAKKNWHRKNKCFIFCIIKKISSAKFVLLRVEKKYDICTTNEGSFKLNFSKKKWDARKTTKTLLSFSFAMNFQLFRWTSIRFIAALLYLLLPCSTKWAFCTRVWVGSIVCSK